MQLPQAVLRFDAPVVRHFVKYGIVGASNTILTFVIYTVLVKKVGVDYLAALGLDEPGLTRVIRAGYKLLDLVTFLTVGPKEARAWTVSHGMKAPQAAGVIHTDFEKGFIRAETIAYDDFVAWNGEQGAKDSGKMRLEGADYVVADGDIMHFRFNL